MELELLKRKLAQGSLAGLVRVGLAVPLYLILTPFVLKTLGPELFGLWSFSTLVVSVMTLTDFGFKNALVYYVARELGQPESTTCRFNVALAIYCAMTLTVGAVVWIFGQAIVADVLRVPASLHAEAWFVLWITALGFGLRFVSIPFQALLEAHQEHGPIQRVLTAWLLANFAGTLIALTARPDIYALGCAGLVANALVLALFWRLARRRYPAIRIAPGTLRISTLKSMAGYGSGVQVATLVIASREPLLKILVARIYDLTTVASFEVVYRLCSQLVSVVTAPLLGSFAASALLAKGRTRELGEVLRPMFGFCVMVFVPAVLFFSSFAQRLVEVWLGPGHGQVAAMLPLAFAAFAIYYTTETLYKAIEASGLSLYSAVVQSVSLTGCVSAFLWLKDVPEQAIPMALFAGFALASLSNALVFRWRFPEIHLCTWPQWGWLLGPASLYVGGWIWAPRALLPGVFAGYLVVHLWCGRRAGLFDYVLVARKLVATVGAKS